MKKTIRIGVIGLGCRGSSIMNAVLLNMEGVTVSAVCDVYADRVASAAEAVQARCGKRPFETDDARALLAREDVDCVYIATSWKDHIPLSIAAMEAGKAVACEVGGAYTVADCEELVAVWERTRVPIMMMENCCYDRQELLVTAMARKGVFGKVVHCAGAYSHDLRGEVAYGDINRHYRLHEYIDRNRDNYPTHELGPIAKLLNINRGNRMVSLTAMGSAACGLHAFVQDKPELAALHNTVFAQSDIFHTLIKCENGETILLKLDTTLPRFYSREFTVRGTKGLYDQTNAMVYLDGMCEHEIWNPLDGVKRFGGNETQFEEAYMPSLWKDITPEEMAAGHGGMDYLEFREFFDALREGREMPIDVYDMASWMVVSCLSEESAACGGKAMEIPDFTRGAYKTREAKDVIPL